MNLYKIHAWRTNFPREQPNIDLFAACNDENAIRKALECPVSWTDENGVTHSQLPHACKILETRPVPEGLFSRVSSFPLEQWGTVEYDRAWSMLRGAKAALKDRKNSLYVNDLMKEKLNPFVEQFGGVSRAVTIVADRYSELMETERQGLEEIFSQEEREYLFDRLKEVTFEPAAEIANVVIAALTRTGQAMSPEPFSEGDGAPGCTSLCLGRLR